MLIIFSCNCCLTLPMYAGFTLHFSFCQNPIGNAGLSARQSAEGPGKTAGVCLETHQMLSCPLPKSNHSIFDLCPLSPNIGLFV